MLSGRLLHATAALRLRARSRRIRTTAIWGSTLKNNEVGPAVYVDFLPQALADHRYQAAPEPHVVGTGLDYLQAAFAAHIRGVSASKVVVTL